MRRVVLLLVSIVYAIVGQRLYPPTHTHTHTISCMRRVVLLLVSIVYAVVGQRLRPPLYIYIYIYPVCAGLCCCW